MSTRFAVLALALAPLCAGAAAKPYSPMYGRIRLIAGSADAGAQDGVYTAATFRGPRGLAVSADGKTLYVADAGNHAVRAIHLDQQNRVETLCRGFQRPTDVAISIDQASLYIYDRGSRSIQQLELKSRALRPVIRLRPGQDAGILPLGLLLSPDGDHLCFIDPVEGELLVGSFKARILHVAMKAAIFSEPGAQLSDSAGHLRCFSSSRQQLFGFSLHGSQIDWAALAKLPDGASLDLMPRDTVPSCQGFAGFGAQASRPGLLAWDANQACFGVYEDPHFTSLALRDYEGVDRSFGSEKRTFFRGPVSLAYDPGRAIIYVSQADSNQVSAVRDAAPWGTPDPFNSAQEMTPEKPVGVTRILFFGSPRVFGPGDTPQSLSRSLPAQFQLALNLMSALQGDGGQYEVAYDVQAEGAMGSGEAALGEHPDLLKDYHFDYVFFPVSDQTLWEHVGAWARVRTQDDVPLESSDPAWAAEPLAQRVASMGPAARSMVAYCAQSHQGCPELMSFFPTQEPSFSYACGSPLSFFEVPRLRQLSLQVEGKLAAKVAALCKAQGVQPLAWVLPTKAVMGGGENDGACKTFDGSLAEAQAQALQAQGLPAVDLVELARVLEPQAFPLWDGAGDQFSERGGQWLASLMATEFMRQKEGL